MARKDLRQVSVRIEAKDIQACPTMQLATSHNEQPWNATVYFVYHEGRFYWLSFRQRRHSEELALNPRAAVAIVIEPNQPVVGFQAEGMVDIVENVDEAESVLALYIEKYSQGRQFIELFKAGRNKHMLYRFVPHSMMLFDERNPSILSPTEVIIT